MEPGTTARRSERSSQGTAPRAGAARRASPAPPPSGRGKTEETEHVAVAGCGERRQRRSPAGPQRSETALRVRPPWRSHAAVHLSNPTERTTPRVSPMSAGDRVMMRQRGSNAAAKAPLRRGPMAGKAVRVGGQGVLQSHKKRYRVSCADLSTASFHSNSQHPFLEI